MESTICKRTAVPTLHDTDTLFGCIKMYLHQPIASSKYEADNAFTETPNLH